LEIAEWMLANGSDVHRDDESALGAALSPDRLPMLKLFVAPRREPRRAGVGLVPDDVLPG
jgi:hypothetical protein